MLKEVLRNLDSGLLPEIGLIAFFVAFLLIVTRVMLMKKTERDAAKHLPLDDPEPLPPATPQDHAEPTR